MNGEASYRDDCFVTTEELKTKYAGRSLFLFGLGQEATKLVKRLSGYGIGGYIDNYRCGGTFNGGRILSLKEYHKDDSLVVITTARYMKEMYDQLTGEGFEPASDFVVWDEYYLFHTCDAVDRFVDYNQSLYQRDRISSETKILIACDNKCNMSPTVYGMCANYLSKKYQASIVGYMRFGNSAANLSPTMRRIYDSINVCDFISHEINGELQKEVDQILETKWPGIRSFEDWRSIRIYDIDFGTSMIRTINRLRVSDFDPASDRMKELFLEQVRVIVFWYHWFKRNDVKAVLLGDGVNWDSYIRDIAVSNGIEAYSLDAFRKMTLDFSMFPIYEYYDKFWDELSEREKKIGTEWAKEHIKRRVRGSAEDIPNWISRSVFDPNDQMSESVTEETGRIKLLICPHIFEEDSYPMGEHLFDNNYVSWLDHLGQLSQKTDYDWYMKMHPDAQRLDEIMISKFLERYPNIKLLDRRTSPHQLKKEGVKYALTVFGSIGHEYPALGITVINAGKNPGMRFNFNVNPKSKEEYDNVLLNLDSFDESSLDIDDLYRFYCIQYLYYDRTPFPFYGFFFKSPELYLNRHELDKAGKDYGPWMFEKYLEETSIKEDEMRKQKVGIIFEKMNSWRPDCFYRKELDLDMIERELEE